jgi:hypothetical protein
VDGCVGRSAVSPGTLPDAAPVHADRPRRSSASTTTRTSRARARRS